MSLGPVKHYRDILFEDFETAKRARKILYSYTKSMGKVSVGNFIHILCGVKDLNFKYLNHRGDSEDDLYGWIKKGHLAIYEYNDIAGKTYYTFEDPVCFYKIIVA